MRLARFRFRIVRRVVSPWIVAGLFAAVTGTVGNLQYGSIDFGVAAPVTVAEIAGALAGTRIVHAVNVEIVRRFVAVLCVVVGIALFLSLGLAQAS